MIKPTYDQLVKRICSATKLSVEEVERRVLEKKSKLSDLISKEGAAQIVAAELGVDFDGQKVKINELMTGMRKATLIAKITRVFPPRGFMTKNGAESKVMNLFIADETGNSKCVLWDVNQIKLFEEGKLKEGDTVELKDAAVRENTGNLEVHLGSISQISLSSEVISGTFSPQKPAILKTTLSGLSDNMRASVRAVIVQVFEPRFFIVCPECGKKVSIEGDKFKCLTHNFVMPSERALMNFTLDDGTGNMRSVGFSDVLKKIFGVDDAGIKSITPETRNELLGKEMIFVGRARKNVMYNTLEFQIGDIEEVTPDSLMQELSKK